MSRNKREEQLRENEKYPLRSLTTEQQHALKQAEQPEKKKDE